MKIRDRITLTFALTAFAAVSVLGMFIYYFTAHFHEQEFFKRLEERVDLTEKIFLEKNEVVTEAVREKFLQRLDAEKEYAITLNPTGLDSLDDLFFKGFSKSLVQNEAMRFRLKEQQCFGKIYHLPSGKYAVVVTAVDNFGTTKLCLLKKMLFIGVALTVLLLAIVGWMTANHALRPLEDKILLASHISASRLGLRLEVKNPDDELGQLAVAFNRMLDRLQTGFEAQRHFVSNASHEMRNPLTTIIGEAELLLEKDRSNEEYKEAVQIIGTEAERLQTLTRRLLDLAKAESLSALPDPENVPLDLCLLEVLEKFPSHRLRLDMASSDQERTITGSRHLLHSAFTNLVDNALKFSGEKPVSIDFYEKNGRYEIKITDHGIGIPAVEMAHIYQPLFRARNVRGVKGHGLGLPLCKKIIELHGGTLTIEAQENEGTVAIVSLRMR